MARCTDRAAKGMPLDGDQLDLIQREAFQRQRRTDRPSPPAAHRAGASSSKAQSDRARPISTVNRIHARLI
jgi:hypothetical protein